MKTLFLGFISLFMFVSIHQKQETKTITATFDFYEEGVYYFSDREEDSYDFAKIEKDVLKKFDLKSYAYRDIKFKITYKEEMQKEEFITFHLSLSVILFFLI